MKVVSHVGHEFKSISDHFKNFRFGRRVAIIVLKNACLSMEFISKKLNISRQSISKWVNRYKQEGIAGLEDRPRFGRKCLLSSNEISRIENMISSISERKTHWRCQSGNILVRRFLPKLFQGISRSTIYRILKKCLFKKLSPRPVHIKKSEFFCEKWIKNIRPKFYRLKNKYFKKEIEVFFQDETRYGQQTIQHKIWAKKGSRPVFKKQSGFLNSWIYGAISPKSGKKFGLILPKLNTENMQIFLKKFSKRIHYSKHALLILDGSSAHRSKGLKIPKNISLHFLPPYSPELNPIERLWLQIKKNYLSFKTYENQKKLNQAGADAWNKIDGKIIKSLCRVDYL